MADEDRDPQGPGAEVSEAQIAVHWREEEYYPVHRPHSSPRPTSRSRRQGAIRRGKLPRMLPGIRRAADLGTPWHTTLDTSNAPFWKWFVGGKLNASYNCVDRHAAAKPDKTAIIFVPELESDEPCTSATVSCTGR